MLGLSYFNYLLSVTRGACARYVHVGVALHFYACLRNLRYGRNKTLPFWLGIRANLTAFWIFPSGKIASVSRVNLPCAANDISPTMRVRRFSGPIFSMTFATQNPLPSEQGGEVFGQSAADGVDGRARTVIADKRLGFGDPVRVIGGAGRVWCGSDQRPWRKRVPGMKKGRAEAHPKISDDTQRRHPASVYFTVLTSASGADFSRRTNKRLSALT